MQNGAINPNLGPNFTRNTQALGPTRVPGDVQATDVNATGPVDGGPDGRTMISHKLNDNWKSMAAGDSYKLHFGKQPYVKDLKDENLRGELMEIPEEACPGLQEKAKAGTLKPEDIKNLQSMLQSKGYDLGPGGVDGKFGPCTHKALEKFLNGEAPDKAAPGKADPKKAQTGTTRTTAGGPTPRMMGEDQGPTHTYIV